MIIPIFVIGLISSIISEILKAIPVLGKTKSRKRILAFVISVIIVFLYLSTTENEYTEYGLVALFLGSIGASFVVYKSIIKTIEGPIKRSAKK